MANQINEIMSVTEMETFLEESFENNPSETSSIKRNYNNAKSNFKLRKNENIYIEKLNTLCIAVEEIFEQLYKDKSYDDNEAKSYEDEDDKQSICEISEAHDEYEDDFEQDESSSFPIFDNTGIEMKRKLYINFKNNDNLRNLFTHCFRQCPELSRFPLKKRVMNGKTMGVILTLPPQGGKTKTLLYVLTLQIAMNNNVIITSQNSRNDYVQLEGNIEKFRTELNRHCQSEGFNPVIMSPLYVGKNESLYKIPERMRCGGAIICTLDNIIQLKKLSDILDKNKTTILPYIMIYDESDKTLKEHPCNNSGRDRERLKIMSNANFVINVTATPVGHFLVEGNFILQENVIRCRDNPFYIGFEHEKTQFVSISSSKTKHSKKANIGSDTLSKYVWFTNALKNFEKHCRVLRTNNEPHDMLIKISNLVNNHREIRNYLSRKYPRYLSLINNGDKMELYFPHADVHLGHWGFDGYVKIDNVHTWDAAPYGHLKTNILQLYRQYNIEHIPMFEIAGDKADRGITYKTSNHEWLISAMLYMDNDNVDYATAYQAVGRLFGLRSDLDTKQLYTSDAIYNKLVIGKATNDEYVNKELEELPDIKITITPEGPDETIAESTTTMTEILKELKISVPSSKVRMCRAITLSKQRSKINIETHEDNGKINVVVAETITGRVNKAIYDAAISAVIDLVGTGVWVRRAEVVSRCLMMDNEFTTDIDKERLRARLTDFAKIYKHSTTEDETVTGLLIRKISGSIEWELRVN